MVHLTNLNILEIPADIDWAMLIAYNRGKMDKIQGTDFYNKYASMTKNVDLVIGSIANDRIFFVIDNFFQEQITDEALIKSLSILDIGSQYVALTEKACNAINIEKVVELSPLECKSLQEINQENRIKGISLANNICKDYRREGRFFDEIIEGAK